MKQRNSPESKRWIIPILKVLSETSEPVGSTVISRELERHGISMSARGVRYHFRITDSLGYTHPMGRNGRTLTPLGLEKLELELAPEHIGFISERLESLALQTTFNPWKRTGLVPINTSLIDKEQFNEAFTVMKDVFQAGICASELVCVASEGQKLGTVIVPQGKMGIATVSSVVANGVLSKTGVPIESKFGGVLEIRSPRPERFVAIIRYASTSLDPSEQYIRARLTSVREAVRIGNGRILADFREIPSQSRTVVSEKLELLKEAGINGVYRLGNVSESLCQISPGLNRVGLVLLSGLNPLAAVAEAGIGVENTGESGLIDYSQLTSFSKI